MDKQKKFISPIGKYYISRADALQGYLVASIAFLLILWGILSEYQSEANNVMGGMVLLISILLLYRNRNSLSISILYVFILYANYSVVVGVYWVPQIRPNVNLYDQIADNSVYSDAIIMMLLFELALYLFDLVDKKNVADPLTSKSRAPKEELSFKKPYPNKWISVFCSVIYLITYFTQIDFNTNGRAAGNPLSEYIYVFVIIAWLYSPNTKEMKLLWSLLVGLTSLMTFATGNRAAALPNLILLVLLWYPGVSVKRLLPFIPVAIILFKVIAVIRVNFSFSLDSLNAVIQAVPNDLFTSDTYTFAYLPGLLTMLVTKRIPFLTKADLLFKNAIYIFVGGSYGQYVLPSYSRKFYVHYFGFFAPLTFYFWFGVAGAIITALIVQLHIRILKDRKATGLPFLMGCVFVAIESRWYGYNFLQLLRADFLITLMWCAFCVIDGLTKKSIGKPKPKQKVSIKN